MQYWWCYMIISTYVWWNQSPQTMYWLFKGIAYKSDQSGWTWPENSQSSKFSNKISLGDNDRKANDEMCSWLIYQWNNWLIYLKYFWVLLHTDPKVVMYQWTELHMVKNSYWIWGSHLISRLAIERSRGLCQSFHFSEILLNITAFF